LFRSPLIIYSKGLQPVTIDKPVSSLDIIPTISNLLGLEYDSRLLMGRDIFSDADPLVIFKNRSWITDKGKYNAVTQKFIPKDGAEVSEEYIEWMNAIVESKFFYSQKVLETDYYRKVLEDYEE
jgi:lipoteichoic acid synthase